MEISIEDAYAEACRALGESVVQQRILGRAFNEQVATLTEQLDKARGAEAVPKTWQEDH